MPSRIGTIAVLIGVIVVLGTVVQLRAEERTPDLNWLDDAQGRNFHYELSNATFSQEFNATVVSDTGNTQTFRFWVTQNGTDKTVRNLTMNTTREVLNFTETMTFMWINSTNVLDGEAKIGNFTYPLDALASTASVTVFGDDNRTFKFNALKGWLIEANFRDLDLNWTMHSTSTGVNGPLQGITNTILFCDTNDNVGEGQFTDGVRFDRDPLPEPPDADRISTVNICWKDEPLVEDRCRINVVAASQVAWWGWLLDFGTTQAGLPGGFSFEHDIRGTAVDGIFREGNFENHVPLDRNRPLWATIITQTGLDEAFVDEDVTVTSLTALSGSPDRFAEVDKVFNTNNC